mgnify:CR=1 FL=1
MLGKGPRAQFESKMRNRLDGLECWPESETMKERHTSGKTETPRQDSNGWESKKAKAIMEGQECSPEHKALKERLAAGIKMEENVGPAKPRSASEKLLDNVEMDQWPEFCKMNQRTKKGDTSSEPTRTEELVNPIEYPANECLKERLDKIKGEEAKKADLTTNTAQIEVFDDSELFDGIWWLKNSRPQVLTNESWEKYASLKNDYH